MTLRLVPDSADVIPLDIRNWRDVPGQARCFAEDVEAGEYGEVSKVIVVIDTPDGLHLVSWGDSMTQFEAVGMLDVAKFTNIASLLDNADDD